MAVLTNARDERKIGDRKPFLERIAQAEKKNLSADETAALAADLVRIGRLDDAQNRLAARLRDRNPNYFVFTTYAAIRATAGDWAEALRYHTAAQLDSEMPTTARGLSQSQSQWWQKLDRDYVPHYYRLRLKETEERKNKSRSEVEALNEAENIFPLFPAPTRANPQPQPVRFVNDAGVYQPGHLAAAERAKLPPDALAIVQQLVLWFPGDSRLYWLLAELYAADGDYAAAWKLFQSLSWGRAYSSHKIMMDHRQAVEAALNSQPRKATDDVALVSSVPKSTVPPADSPADPGQQPISMKTVWIYFGAVGLIAVFAFLRVIVRRMRGNCGPLG